MAERVGTTTTTSAFPRYLGFLKPPDPNPNPSSSSNSNCLLDELDESDVVWSSSSSDAAASPASSLSSNSSSSSSSGAHLRRPFLREKLGLSALLDGAEPIPSAPRPPAAPEKTVPFHQSAPVAVPVWQKREKRSVLFAEDDLIEGSGYLEEEEEAETEMGMVPPHEMAKARSRAMAFSVLEGTGRTLKGRDLRRVRNAVWRETGFLDL